MKNRIVIRYAFRIYAGIVLYFLLMKLLGLEKIPLLRLLNFPIVLWGFNGSVMATLKRQKRADTLSAMFAGFSAAMLSIMLSAGSLFIYLKWIDPPFIHALEDSMLWGEHLSPALITLVILFEGTASNAISSLLVIQYRKNYQLSS